MDRPKGYSIETKGKIIGYRLKESSQTESQRNNHTYIRLRKWINYSCYTYTTSFKTHELRLTVIVNIDLPTSLDRPIHDSRPVMIVEE